MSDPKHETTEQWTKHHQCSAPLHYPNGMPDTKPSIDEVAAKHPFFYINTAHGSIQTKSTNPKDRAATHRLDLTLFPEPARIFGAIAMTEGDYKYGGYNYRDAGVNVSTYVAALGRHIGKYYDLGEWADPITGVPHLANALACIAILIDGHVMQNINDDRPPVVPENLYSWAESVVKKLHELYPEGPERYKEIN